jgi:hypothetical protein
VLHTPHYNLIDVRPVNRMWAIAYTLHFFTGVEDAEVLLKYNPLASQFLHNGKLKGAYGAMAMPQLRRCIAHLSKHRQSRRAVVQFGELPEHTDINRPACITSLHFMLHSGALCMHVYQRSLNLYGVMPYDCILLSNIHAWVASQLYELIGRLVWTVGSLHAKDGDRAGEPSMEGRHRSLLLPTELLSDGATCVAALENPVAYGLV